MAGEGGISDMKKLCRRSASERMVSVQRNYVLELCEFDHVQFANRSRVGGRTNRLEGACALPSQKPSEIRPNANAAREWCSVRVLNFRPRAVSSDGRAPDF